MFEREDWEFYGLCNHIGTDVFFPDKGVIGHDQSESAKLICGRCPVRQQCRAFAIDNPELTQYGIWGGTTPAERRKIWGTLSGSDGMG
ncbi:WhiB family transcription factor [Gordonia phage Keelan]|nr:WhiB family transcription factor [Gordonia phage Keelan]